MVHHYHGRPQPICMYKWLFIPKSTTNTGSSTSSVLGSVHFSLYTLPAGDTGRKHHVHYYQNTNNTQLYITIKPGHKKKAFTTISSIISDLHCWMTQNFLKFNADKTDVLLLGSKQLCWDFNPHTLSIEFISASLNYPVQKHWA